MPQAAEWYVQNIPNYLPDTKVAEVLYSDPHHLFWCIAQLYIDIQANLLIFDASYLPCIELRKLLSIIHHSRIIVTSKSQDYWVSDIGEELQIVAGIWWAFNKCWLSFLERAPNISIQILHLFP